MNEFTDVELQLLNRAIMMLAFVTENGLKIKLCYNLADRIRSELNVRKMIDEDNQKNEEPT